MRQFHVRALATVAVAAFALAACGSSTKASSTTGTTGATTTTAAQTPTTKASGPVTLTVATTKLGKVLVDAKGMTLYRFDNDTTPGKSTCTTGQCASTWPAAIVTGTPNAGPGVAAAKVSTFMLADGKAQLEIAGHPLYTFAGDAKAGDTNGQGIIGKWYAAGPAGDKVGDKS
ncbi:MAG TPA: hypothetical protein VGP92_15065 [Acidimicrobiia bacterium]|jgi:predicted lipoprotein with Yx(FWY)xxD motif|nr:hypothetical protein [Acidimicrobiia bacterium]